MPHRVWMAVMPQSLLCVFAAAQVVSSTQTHAQSACDPNYVGACVPIATDVDCAGGSGNGPEYVEGIVRVVGSDIYGLDRDNDGLGCELSRS
jgi:hypothetical protein